MTTHRPSGRRTDWGRRRGIAVLAAAMLAPASGAAQAPVERFTLETRAERTAFRETSSYADVMAFVEEADAASERIHLTSLGYSWEGRSLPLVVVGQVDGPSAEAVRASGKTRVYIQGNIHAGEVCGKEALQMLLRSLANGARAEWLDSLVLLIAPIYNADGNERVNLVNRGRQHGPVGGMGQRPNAQGLDLNRDHMKVESPEARSLLRLMKEYDPHVVVDLHTTDGSYHAYYLTYAPPLHPNTHPAITSLLRERMLPAVTEAVKADHGWDFYYYGNLPFPGMDAERGWYTFDHRPRFNNNYVGLRNRIAILGEAYAYATFEDRVRASLWLVEAIGDYAYRHASELRRIVEEADAAPIIGTRLALRAMLTPSPDSVTVWLGDVVEERNPYSGRPMLRRLDVRRAERMREFGSFRATESETVPAAYFVPPDLQSVVRILDDHGIRWVRLDHAITDRLQRFAVDSSSVEPRESQGHRERTLFGSYEDAQLTVPAGSVMVPVDQPLGRLAFTLLEPRSDDGLADWNVLDDVMTDARYYPIVRLVAR